MWRRGSARRAPAGRALATDKRFADPAWRENPVFFAIGQAYLAAVQLADDLLAAGRGDPVTDAKARLASWRVPGTSSSTSGTTRACPGRWTPGRSRSAGTWRPPPARSSSATT